MVNTQLNGKHILSVTLYNNHTGKKVVEKEIVDNIEVRENELWIEITKR